MAVRSPLHVSYRPVMDLEPPPAELGLPGDVEIAGGPFQAQLLQRSPSPLLLMVGAPGCRGLAQTAGSEEVEVLPQ